MYLIKNFPKIKISVLNQKKLSYELKKLLKEKKLIRSKYYRILIKLKQKNLILFFWKFYSIFKKS